MLGKVREAGELGCGCLLTLLGPLVKLIGILLLVAFVLFLRPGGSGLFAFLRPTTKAWEIRVINEGGGFYAKGDVAAAVARWDRALWLSRLFKNPDIKARAHTLKADAANAQGRTGEAREEAYDARMLAGLYEAQGPAEKAMALYDQSLAAARAANNRQEEALTLENSGLYLSTHGDLDKAFDRCSTAVDIWKAEGDHAREATALTSLGAVYYRAGQYDREIELYRQALEGHRAAQNLPQQAVTLMNMGLAYCQNAELDKGRAAYDESLQLARTIKDRSLELTILGNLATLEREQKHWDQAEDLARQALKIVEETGERFATADILSSLSDIASHAGRYDEALDWGNKAYASAEKSSNRSQMAITLYMIGRAYTLCPSQFSRTDDSVAQAGLSATRTHGGSQWKSVVLENVVGSSSALPSVHRWRLN